ncbi:MAG: hypothetical protein IJN70_08995 [Clostridia bacterium]|nr:hypothetical protein [Clostridia bacterium]
MKKAASIVFSVCILAMAVFSACEKEMSAEDFMPRDFFSLSMKGEKDGKTFEADVICSSYEDIEIAFTYPGELSGFSVKTEGDGYSINAFGVPDERKSDEIKDTSLLNVIVRSIRLAVFTNHKSFTKTENGFEADVIAETVKVKLGFSEDGYITYLSAPEAGFSAEFQNQG